MEKYSGNAIIDISSIKANNLALRKHRGSIRIIRDLLIQCKIATKKTLIMYAVRLSHKQLEGYLQFLQSEGFVRQFQNNDGRFFQITEKGLTFLEKMDETVKVIDRLPVI